MEWRETVAGGAAGVAQNVVGFPLDSVKIRMVTQAAPGVSLATTVRAMYAADGLAGFFRGVQSPMVGLLCMNALVFSSYAKARSVLSPSGVAEAPLFSVFAAGAVAGAALSLAECPVDFVKTQLQVKRFAGLGEAVSTIYRGRGVTGLFGGFLPTLLRNVPGWCSGRLFVAPS